MNSCCNAKYFILSESQNHFLQTTLLSLQPIEFFISIFVFSLLNLSPNNALNFLNFSVKTFNLPKEFSKIKIKFYRQMSLVYKLFLIFTPEIVSPYLMFLSSQNLVCVWRTMEKVGILASFFSVCHRTWSIPYSQLFGPLVKYWLISPM